MGPPNTRLLQGPIGPLRDKYVRAVGADDIDLSEHGGVVVQANAAGDLTYVTLEGTEQTETLVAGAVVNAAGIPVLIKEIKGSSTLNSVIIGVI